MICCPASIAGINFRHQLQALITREGRCQLNGRWMACTYVKGVGFFTAVEPAADGNRLVFPAFDGLEIKQRQVIRADANSEFVVEI